LKNTSKNKSAKTKVSKAVIGPKSTLKSSKEKGKPPFQEVSVKIASSDLLIKVHSPDQHLLKWVQDAVFYALNDYTQEINSRVEGPFNRREPEPEEVVETRVLGLDTSELINAREEQEDEE